MQIVLLIVSILSIQSFLFCEDKLEEVTIKADLNLQMDSSKPKLNVDFDKNYILKNTIELEPSIFSVSPKSLDDISAALPTIIFSKNPISPALIDIVKEPVLNFRMKSFPNFNVKKWKINITDAKGEMFAYINGKSSFPDVIPWMGKNYKNEMLIPGKWYSYNLVVTDEFGYKYTVQGENFNFKGVRYKKGKEQVVSLSLSDLFSIGKDKDNVVIKNDGKKLLNEALDIIKENYKKPIKITIYDMKEQTGLNRGQKILEYFVSNLYIKDVNINVQFIACDVSDDRVDIQIYNK